MAGWLLLRSGSVETVGFDSFWVLGKVETRPRRPNDGCMRAVLASSEQLGRHTRDKDPAETQAAVPERDSRDAQSLKGAVLHGTQGAGGLAALCGRDAAARAARARNRARAERRVRGLYQRPTTFIWNSVGF